MRLSSLTLSLALVSTGLSAHADSFNFTFGNSSNAFSGSGILTTGALQAPGEYAIASITGSATVAPLGSSFVINSILAPGTFPTVANGGIFPANDNVLFVTRGIGALDGYGLAFILSNGAQINLYNPQGFATDALLKTAGGPDVFEAAPISITAIAPVPEPSSLTLLAAGLMGVAGIVKRKLV